MSAKVQSGECNRKGGGALRGPVHPKLYSHLFPSHSHLKSVEDADVHSLNQNSEAPAPSRRRRRPHARLTAATDELTVCFGL
jgi:hypothetical protein